MQSRVIFKNITGTIFWADLNSIINYNYFGDTVTFDTTYIKLLLSPLCSIYRVEPSCPVMLLLVDIIFLVSHVVFFGEDLLLLDFEKKMEMIQCLLV